MHIRFYRYDRCIYFDVIYIIQRSVFMKEYKRFKEDCLYILNGNTSLYLSKVINDIITVRIRQTLTLYYETLIYTIYIGEKTGRDVSKRIDIIHNKLLGYTQALVNCYYAKEALYKMAKETVKIIRKELE